MTSHIIIGGASGLIGQALARALAARGDRVTALVRRPERGRHEIRWDPPTGLLDPQRVVGADAVVLLNGASVGRLPWTRAYRAQLRSSRLQSTTTMVTALRALGSDAPALVSGSAVGFYGSAPGQVLTESAGPGHTFLAELSRDWEHAARAAQSVTRVALVRTAPVIERRGVLAPMIALTSLGLGGRLGRGDQMWPWVSLDDEVRAILHIIDHELAGPVNVCGPTPATAEQTGRALARELHRPFWLPAPAWGLRMLLGAPAADSLLLADADVRPEALLRSGFTFEYETVESAVRAAMR